ncbi:hypothetical protein [Pedobacter xixiisoli]|uniref:Uncharacterized protein n=1 Tax=Pedobacter xixiisoli TaxID=1476464 RepID=A0A285ZX46_9SPHI|nr:hypothetical protein [Pedobacter xixiisoli]SOD14233.1 hypothetical protein SAMN06297358_1471 [Pedobacter xixiisoli]
MKTLKIIRILFILGSFTACKKDKVDTPEPAQEPFAITDYVLVEKGLGVDDNDHLITTFELQGKAIWYTLLGYLEGPKYTFEDGVLKIYLGGTVEREFKIENQKIVSHSVKFQPYSCQLVKISKSNVLDGNTYNGGWRNEGSLIVSVSKLKFTDTHYAEASLNLPVPNNEYKSLKNIGAYSRINNVNTLWILINGKLEGSRKYESGNIAIGDFNKQ